MMMRISLTVALLSFVFLGVGCDIYGPGGSIGANDATMFTAALTGAAERPDAVETDATGTGTFSLNADESELSFNISASGLSGDVTAAHFHFAADGAAGFGDFVFAITQTVANDGNGGATAEGTWNLTSGDLANLRLNYIYVNFHTDANPAGEIRGNLVPAP